MEFLGDLECVIGHLGNGQTIEVKSRPGTHDVVLLSPVTLVISRVRSLGTQFVSRFDISQNLKEKGLFLKCAWVDTDSLAVLTSLGKLVLFRVEKERLAPTLIISSRHGEYTAVSAYQNRFILVGDVHGNLIVLSLSGMILQRKTIAEYAIKQIEVTRTKLAVLMSDGRVFWANIAKAIVATHDVDVFQSLGDFHLIPKTWTKVVGHWENHLFALCNTGDNVLVTDFEKFHKELKCEGVTSLYFSPRMSNLFLACRKEINIWNSERDSLSAYTCNDCVCGHSMTIANQSVLVVVEQGILLYSIMKLAHSSTPMFFSNSQVVDWRILRDRNVVSVHQCPGDDPIRHVAADGYDNFTAVATGTDVRLFSRRLGSFIQGKYRIPRIETMCWHKHWLLVITREQRTGKHFAEFLEVCPDGLKRVKKIALTGKPTCLGSDMFHHAVIGVKKSVVVINAELEVWECVIPWTLADVYPCVRHHTLFGLTRSREFVSLSMFREDSQPTVIMQNVSFFTICAEQSLMFCVQGHNILMAKLGSRKLEPFGSTDSPVIGIEPAKRSLLLYEDKQLHLLSYLDCLIVMRLDNPQTSLKLLEKSGERKLPFLTNLLLTAIAMKRAPACIRLLKSFPLDLQRQVTVHALRRLERCDRSLLKDLIDNPLALFCAISDTHTSEGYDTITFHSNSDNTSTDYKLAALLLPVLLEEYGPSVAFPAAFFCLTVDHSSLESVRSYARFLEPLLVKAIATSTETVSCVGMEIEVGMYAELKQELEEVVCLCIADLIKQLRPQDALEISALMRVPMTACLTRPQYVSLKTQFSQSQLHAQFTELTTSNRIYPYQITILIRDFDAAGWTEWSTALRNCTNSTSL